MANKKLEELRVIAEQAQKAYEDELKLAKQKEAEEAERKKAALAAEKEKRYQEIQDAEKKLRELKTAYIKDYGSYYAFRTSEDPIVSLFKVMLGDSYGN